MKTLKFLTLTLLVNTALVSIAFAQDVDNDGVTDAVDNCKFTYNPTQLDTDADGIGDDCDCEPMVANPMGQHVPSILITASPSTSINSGTLVSFTTTIDAGGSSPIYQWEKNSSAVGANSPTYADSLLNNGDVVTCQLTSNVVCALRDSALSNSLTFVINPVSVIEKSGIKELVLIYPNPAKKEIYIKSIIEIDTVKIIDASGKTIKIVRADNNKINVEELTAGVYTIQFISNGTYVTRSLVIE